MKTNIIRRDSKFFLLAVMFVFTMIISCTVGKNPLSADLTNIGTETIKSDIESSAVEGESDESGARAEDMTSLLKQDHTYRIGVGDSLLVSVWQHPELGTDGVVAGRDGTAVEEDGGIFLPLVGEIKVASLTIGEARKKLTEAYSKYVKNPQVVVSIQNYGSKSFYIIGEVKNAGSYQIKYPVSLRQSLSIAGGLLPSADLERAYIIRNDLLLPIDFRRLVEDGASKMDVEVINDDFIFIPRKGEESIYVIGEVKTPGMVKMIDGKMNLLSAIASSGDFTIFAVKDNVKIIRGSLTAPEVITADLGNLSNETGKGNIFNLELQSGDIIYVPDTSIGRLDKILQKIAPVLRTINEGFQPFYMYDLIINRK